MPDINLIALKVRSDACHARVGDLVDWFKSQGIMPGEAIDMCSHLIGYISKVRDNQQPDPIVIMAMISAGWADASIDQQNAKEDSDHD